MKKLTALFDLPVLSDINVKAMVLDSRKVTQGDLFVAVKGHRFDASQFVPQSHLFWRKCGRFRNKI